MGLNTVQSIGLSEDLTEWDSGVWLHYSDFPGVKVNPSQFHQDPAGIYLFPEGFETTGSWWKKKYKFRVQLKRDLRILDLAKLSAGECFQILDKLIPSDHPRAVQWEPHKKAIISGGSGYKDHFWEVMKNYFILSSEGANYPSSVTAGPAKWNKALRDIGYDAVFDDTDSIHSAEVQLLVLDPRDIKVIEQEDQKSTGFAEIQASIDHLKKKLSPYGEIEIVEPKKKQGLWSRRKELSAAIKVTNADGDYLSFEIAPRFEGDKDQLPAEIRITPTSNKRLTGSLEYGLSLDLRKGKFNPEDMDVRLQLILGAAFGQLGENWEGMFQSVGEMIVEGYPLHITNLRLWDEVYQALDNSNDNGLDDFQFEIIRNVPMWRLTEVPISDIEFDVPSAPESQKRINRYAKLNTSMPPVILWKEPEDAAWSIVDGYHRVAAAKKSGRTSVEAYVPQDI